MNRDETILDLFHEQVRLGAHRAALRERRLGRWVTTTWGEWAEKSRAVAAALVEAGLAPGERVALLASTRQGWVEVDMGVLMAGGITVPIYPTLSAEQAAHIVADSGARFVFCDGPALAEKLISARNPVAFARVVLFDTRSVEGALDAAEHRAIDLADVVASTSATVESYEAMLERGRRAGEAARAAVEARSASSRAADTASLMYTSGTSGPPRGVVLTHDNLVSEVKALSTRMKLGPQDEQVLFLPLAHVFGRVLEIAQLRTGFVTSFAQSPRTVMDDVLEVNPTFFGSVPRLFEKIRDEARRRATAEGDIKRKMASWALEVGLAASVRKQRGEPLPMALAAQLKYADRLVLAKVRAAFGKRFRFALSGGAPLAADLASWFHAHGVLLLEGYGLTETSSATHLNTPERFRFGTVGWPVPGVEVKLDGDGEILVRGRSITGGYHGQPAATAEAFDPDGFFHTGDVGKLLPDGSLEITDRKKDLIVTSGGKNIAPQNIEAMLRASPWVSQAVVYGDRKKHLVAMLTLSEETAVRWAKERGLPAELPVLVHDAELRALVQREVDEVNQRLARFETIKRFALLDRDLSIEQGELTPTLKIRRRAVYERHRPLFESLYDGEP